MYTFAAIICRPVLKWRRAYPAYCLLCRRQLVGGPDWIWPNGSSRLSSRLRRGSLQIECGRGFLERESSKQMMISAFRAADQRTRSYWIGSPASFSDKNGVSKHSFD